MDNDDELRQATRLFGDELVTLDEFAQLASVGASTLGARRARKQDFPAPVNPGQRPLRYRLTDLADWMRRNPLRSDSPEVQAPPRPASRSWTSADGWSLERAVANCVADHRAAPTQAFLGGLLRLVRDPDFRDLFLREQPAPISSQGLRQLRRRAQAHAKQLGTAAGRRTSEVDLEATVLASLLDGGRTGQFDEPPIPDRSMSAMKLVDAVHQRWQADPVACADEVEDQLLSLSRDSLEVSRRTEDRLVRLLLAIAPPVRGGRFLDPACGYASVLLAAHDAVAGDVSLDGRDRDEQAWLIAKARLDARRVPHRLGRPGDDSLAAGDDLAPGGYDTVVAEPGGKLWDAGRWLEAAARWINDQGTAAVELSSRTLEAKRREAKMIGDRLSAVVITPRRVRPETSERMAIWVLRRTPPGDVLVIDLSGQDQRDGPPGDDEIAAVRDVLAAHHAGEDPTSVPGADRLTVWRVPQQTVADLGVLGAIDGTDPIIGTVFSAEPVMEQARHGLALAEELLTLLDGTGGTDGAGGRAGDGPLAQFVTEEVRRGVRRLVKQLGKVVRDGEQAGPAD